MTTFRWGIYSKTAGIQLRGHEYATAAEALAVCETLDAEYAAFLATKATPKAIARWARFAGRYFVPVSPETQLAWATVEFSR